jgi:integrase
MTSQLTEAAVRAIPAPSKGNRITYFPEAARTGKAPVGFAVRVTAGGARSFLLCYRDAAGDHRATIGRVGAMSLSGAIREASKMRLAIDGGEVVTVKRGAKAEAVEAAKAAKPVTVAAVIDDWTKRVGRDLRTIGAYEGAFRRYVRPALGNLPIHKLTKAPIRDMVDDIRDSAGPIMANQVLGYLGSVLNWWAGRVDDFVPPALKGLRGKAVVRDRLLSAEEIAVLWPTFGEAGTYGVLLKVLLLTGQRRNEIADAKWAEIAEDGATLTIPASRYKTKRNHTVPLSEPVRELLAGLPLVHGTDRVFPTFNFSGQKTKLDARAPGVAHWTLHDLRRTATSLMNEAGIRPDYVERVTHPQITGIAGVYNRYAYLAEKTAALDALAAMVARITGGQGAANVVPLRA